mmetsp:Transcript_6505/g.15076  ORF Transcript_6505/g.15076 Transcript_6505/m.15076 type:complete len:210 (-) Transcript_6505:39-668(-)
MRLVLSPPRAPVAPQQVCRRPLTAHLAAAVVLFAAPCAGRLQRDDARRGHCALLRHLSIPQARFCQPHAALSARRHCGIRPCQRRRLVRPERRAGRCGRAHAHGVPEADAAAARPRRAGDTLRWVVPAEARHARRPAARRPVGDIERAALCRRWLRGHHLLECRHRHEQLQAAAQVRLDRLRSLPQDTARAWQIPLRLLVALWDARGGA